MILFEGFKKIGNFNYLQLKCNKQIITIPVEEVVMDRIQRYLNKVSLPTQDEKYNEYYQLDSPFEELENDGRTK